MSGAARESVRVSRLESGERLLEDALTGLRVVLGGDDAARVEQALQGEGPPDAAVLELLESLGCARGLDEAEARWRQAVFLISLAAERDFPRAREAIERAAAGTAFHRRLGPKLAALSVSEGLAELPLMTRGELRGAFPDGVVFQGVDLAKKVAARELIFASTSGTSGERLQVVSDTSLASFPACFEALWKVGPYTETPRTAVFTTPVCAGPICHLGKSAMEERIEQGATLFLNSTDDVFSIDRALVENVFDELHRFRPHFLFVNPVYLAVLAQRASAWGYAFPPLDAVVSDYQYLSRSQRRLLARHFACPIYNYVGATDLAGSRVAIECEQGALHVRADHLYTEIVRGGRPTAPGELGYLTLTTYNPTVPLVRYVTGDLAAWASAPCRCVIGAEWPAIEFHGRARDTLQLHGRLFTTRDVDEALAAVEGIDYWSLEETSAGALELKVVPALGATPSDACQAALSAALDARVHVALTDRLRADRGQKFRFVIPHGAPAIEHPGLTDDAFTRMRASGE